MFILFPMLSNKNSQTKRAPYLCAFFALLILAALSISSPLQAQQEQPSIGLRTAYFATTGELKETLPNGYGVNFYYDHPLSSLYRKPALLFPQLPASHAELREPK